MPLYEFRCQSCGPFDLRRDMQDAADTASCPRCNQPARRVYSLSSDGRDLLEAWARTLERNREILGRFLERFGELDAGPSEARGAAWPHIGALGGLP